MEKIEKKQDCLIKKIDLNTKDEKSLFIKDKAIDVLKRVDDPELGLDVYTLGLIYELKITNQKKNKNNYNVFIKMTFTTPLCPYGPMLMELIESALKEEIKEINSVKIEITFEPPWQPSEELKTALGLN
ncbi:MAG: metal-sulfur cluster assembly factor [Candidatus Woesearchaeota archaeon]